MGLDSPARDIQVAATALILLDTNALIWLDQGHRRSKALLRAQQRFYVSPATLLELQLLVELGRLRMRSGSLGTVLEDDRWIVDDPPSTSWFMRAGEIGWTRDPFDRLLVAHARLRRWRLATGDAVLLARLTPSERFQL